MKRAFVSGVFVLLVLPAACGGRAAPRGTAPPEQATASTALPTPAGLRISEGEPLPGATSTPAELHADVSFPAPQAPDGDAAGILAGDPDESSVVLGFVDDRSGPAMFQETLKLLDLTSREVRMLFTLPRSYTAASVAINARFMVWSQAHVQVEQPGSMLMLWDRSADNPPVELASDPSAGGPAALAFVMDGAQVVYRVSAGGAQQSESFVWEDLRTRQSRTIYTAPPRTMVFPRVLGGGYIVWTETTTDVASDGAPRLITERYAYMNLSDGNSAQPRRVTLRDGHGYYGAVLDGDVLYFQRDDGVVRIDNWRTDPQAHLIWQRKPDAGTPFVRSSALLAWADSTNGRVVIFDTLDGSTLIDSPSSRSGGLVRAKGVVVWEAFRQSSDPSAQGPVTINWLNVPGEPP